MWECGHFAVKYTWGEEEAFAPTLSVMIPSIGSCVFVKPHGGV